MSKHFICWRFSRENLHVPVFRAKSSVFPCVSCRKHYSNCRCRHKTLLSLVFIAGKLRATYVTGKKAMHPLVFHAGNLTRTVVTDRSHYWRLGCRHKTLDVVVLQVGKHYTRLSYRWANLQALLLQEVQASSSTFQSHYPLDGA